MIGDVSMGNKEKFDGLALAYSQVMSTGRLMGGELNQLIERGFNPLQQISKRTGESIAQLKKRMEDGGLGAGEVTQAFKDATSEGGLFFQAIEKGAQTFNGKVAQMQDSWESLKVAFGTGMNEGLKPWLDKIGGDLSQAESMFAQAGSNLGIALMAAAEGNMDVITKGGIAIGETLKGAIMAGLQGLGELALQELLNRGTGIIGAGVKQATGKELSEHVGLQRSSTGEVIGQQITNRPEVRDSWSDFHESVRQARNQQTEVSDPNPNTNLAAQRAAIEKMAAQIATQTKDVQQQTKLMQEFVRKPMFSR
jgi:tape measure domain-containing protein